MRTTARPETLLFDLAQNLLDETIALFAEAGVELPERRLVQAFPASPQDCAMVVVEPFAVVGGLPGRESIESLSRSKCAATHVLRLGVTVLREVCGMDDDGEAPSAEEITADSRMLLTDAWLLRHGLLGRWRDGTLFSDPNVGHIAMRATVPVRPSDHAGWQQIIDAKTI